MAAADFPHVRLTRRTALAPQSTGPGQLDVGAQPLHSVLRLEVQLPQTLVLKVAKNKHLALI